MSLPPRVRPVSYLQRPSTIDLSHELRELRRRLDELVRERLQGISVASEREYHHLAERECQLLQAQLVTAPE